MLPTYRKYLSARDKLAKQIMDMLDTSDILIEQEIRNTLASNVVLYLSEVFQENPILRQYWDGAIHLASLEVLKKYKIKV